MPNLSGRQADYWRKKFRMEERAMLDYFQRHSRDDVDGSFFLNVFRRGYEAALRRQKRKEDSNA